MSEVAKALQALLKRIQPTGGEKDAAKSHFATIKTRLETVFTVKKFTAAGSFSRDTFIRGHSDVDFFALITLDDIRKGDGWKRSDTVLENFRKEMIGRFRSSTVGRDVHAIVIKFSDLDIDIVPAAWSGFSAENKRPIYLIPDGKGDWMRTSPETHNSFIAAKNLESRGKLRAVAQLTKYWRICRNPPIPLSTFHIEMVLAKEGICTGVKSYAQCLTELLQKMAERDCGPMRDPCGISTTIAAAKTEAQRAIALASVRYSRDHAKAALQAERHGDIDEALRQWNIVFNYKLQRP